MISAIIPVHSFIVPPSNPLAVNGANIGGVVGTVAPVQVTPPRARRAAHPQSEGSRGVAGEGGRRQGGARDGPSGSLVLSMRFHSIIL